VSKKKKKEKRGHENDRWTVKKNTIERFAIKKKKQGAAVSWGKGGLTIVYA